MKLGGVLRMVAGVAAVVAATTGCGDDGATPIDATAVDARMVDAAGIDAPEVCSRQPCSILPQCGCTGDANLPVCDLDLDDLASGGTRCRADLFHGTETTTCSRASTCAPEHTCLGRCARYCDDDDDCAGPGGLCILPILFGNQPIPGVKVCTTDCNPTLAANPTCPAGWGCHLFQEGDGDRRWLTNCEGMPQSGGGVGAACTRSAECQPGLDCFGEGIGMGTHCHPTCVCPGGDCAAGTCPVGTGTCHDYTPPALVGTTTYGKCF